MGEESRDGVDLLLERTATLGDKQFCFEFMENNITQFLKISDLTSSSFIVLPSATISNFLDILNCCIESQTHETFNWQLTYQDKVFSFSVRRDKRGRVLKALDSSTSKKQDSLIIPSGRQGNKIWEAVRDIVSKFKETARVIFRPYQVAANDPVIVVQNSSQPKPTSTPQSDNNGSIEVSKETNLPEKRFFFDLGENKRGQFLKISEVKDSSTSFLLVPTSCLKMFHGVIGHILTNINESE